MQDEHVLREVDRRVRAALMPDAETTDRVIANALAISVAPVRRRWLAVAAGAALAASLGVGGWQWRRMVQMRSEPAPLSITARGSMLVVESQEGRWIIGPVSQRPGGNYVVVIPECKECK